MKTIVSSAICLLVMGGALSSPFYGNDAKNLEVTNGNWANITDYPWAVSFLIGNNLWGAGAIMDTQWILTSAFNCHWMDPSFMTIRVSSSFWNRDGTVYQIEKCIMHENYTGDYDYNIALLKINGEITLGTKTTKKILVPNKARVVNKTHSVSGWGTRSPSYEIVMQLQDADQTVMSDEDCMSIYNFTSVDTYFCANNIDAGPCVFDYGAPLASIYATGKTKLFGLYIGSKNCSDPATWPSLYVDVYQFSSWITTTMANN